MFGRKKIIRDLNPDTPYIRHEGEVMVGLVNGHLKEIQFNYTQNEIFEFINSLPLTKEEKKLCWLNLENR